MNEILNLKPERVWYYFNEICKIPRPSKKEEKIIQWLLDFGKKQNLETIKDEVGNVLIRNLPQKEKKNQKQSFYKAILIWYVKRTQKRIMILIKIR